MRSICSIRALAPIVKLVMATLVLIQFGVFWSDEAAAQDTPISISLSATFNGLGWGIIDGTYYLGGGRTCPPGYTCVPGFFSGTATVEGKVDIVPVSGQQNLFNISQNFQVTKSRRVVRVIATGASLSRFHLPINFARLSFC
jgi:hypothetical protein